MHSGHRPATAAAAAGTPRRGARTPRTHALLNTGLQPAERSQLDDALGVMRRDAGQDYARVRRK